MKKFITLPVICLFLLAMSACASGGSALRVNEEASAHSADSLTLDTAMSEAASYFIRRLPAEAKLALVPFNAHSGRLSDYIFEELWTRFENSGRFIMVDRKNLERVEAEMNHQYQSGKVDDALAVSMTKQYGAEILVHGQISPLGSEYRLTIYATDVEKAASSQRAFIVRPDSRLASLVNVSVDDEVERAVSVMARSLGRTTTVAVGRISYAGTQTVSRLSAWLKNSIITSAQQHQDKLRVATESESADFAVSSRGLTVEPPAEDSPIEAVITGNYSPLDNGAEVLLQLVSAAGNRAVLASARFAFPAAELERRQLTLLPEKDDAAISAAEFAAKQQAIDPYAGKHNQWAFTASPDVLDGIYRDGDFMSMRIYSARDCYFRIIHVDVHGSTQVIYPASARDDNFIRAGQTRRIPDNTRYRLGRPFGEELILVAAYERPFSSGASSAASFSADTISRGLVVENDRHTEMAPSATARFSYSILP